MNQELCKIGRYTYYLEMGENDRPNIGLIRGEKDSIIWDGGNSDTNAELFLSKLSREDAESIRLLLLSHKHWDHVFGAHRYRVPIVASSILKSQLEDMRLLDWTKEGVIKRAENNELCEFGKNNYLNEFKEVGSFTIPIPDIVVDGKLELNLGNVTCVYEPIETCHSKGCSVLYVKEDKILFIGDCLWPNMEGMEESWYYSLTKVIKLKKRLQEFDALYYIDSHEVPIKRDKLFLWMDRLIYILEAAQGHQGNMDLIYQSIPQHLKNITLCYDDCILTACQNCRYE